MGTCCFTPRRTQFLWWYWLLLASIVGIPMLLACWYVARHPATDEGTMETVGRKAARIFWGGVLLSALIAAVVSWKVYGVMHPLNVDQDWRFWSMSAPPM